MNIGKFVGRNTDAKLAKEILLSMGFDDALDGYVLHHSFKDGVIQLVQENIHAQFSHVGGFKLFAGK